MMREILTEWPGPEMAMLFVGAVGFGIAFLIVEAVRWVDRRIRRRSYE